MSQAPVFSCFMKGPCHLTAAGIYPFAGHEVARAFALISTDIKDCNDNLEGLGAMEMDSLKEWEMKFNSKYPIVGKLVKSQQCR